MDRFELSRDEALQMARKMKAETLGFSFIALSASAK